MSVPDRMVRCTLPPFENEKARNEDRAWLGAGSPEAIEKFLAEYCPGPSGRLRSGFQQRVLNRFVDDPPGDTHRYSGSEFLASTGKVLRLQIATRL
jgi:hypothetical protein